jgi:pimeloyl-ACP methyl ester carboxylesterase
VVLVGNSAGGTISVLTALRHPDRVAALVPVDPAIYCGGGTPAWIRPLLRTPQMRHLGPLIARTIQSRGGDLIEAAWHDPGKITPEILAGYTRPLRFEN